MVYASLLANRYLVSRVIPLIAVLAVALNVALVVIVVSVMTGFLDMLRDSGRTLMGDVIITHDIVGIPDYERLIEVLEATPGVAAARTDPGAGLGCGRPVPAPRDRTDVRMQRGRTRWLRWCSPI